MTPPRLALRLLERRLHPDERDELIGDLDEQFRARVMAGGLSRARRWYWRQTMALVWGFARARRDVVSTAHERVRGRWAAATAALDWRYAWRSLRASPSFAAAVLLTLVFGIGLSTAVFSLADGILLRPLPYPQPDRLVRLAEIAPPGAARSRFAQMDDTRGPSGVSDVAIGLWSDSRTLESVTPLSADGRNVTTPHGVDQVDVAEVGGAFFNLLGVAPVSGRLLRPDDSRRNAPPVAVISQRYWRTAFDQRADIVGASLLIDKTACTIVGIAPDTLAFPQTDVAVWTAGQWLWPAPGPRRAFSVSLDVIARLKPGVTIDQAQAEGAEIARRIAMANPAVAGSNVPMATERVRRLADDLAAPVERALVILLWGMAFVLAAAGMNLASLLLARASAREREAALRLALGASRWRVLRPLVLEQIMLTAAGACGGAALAAWIVKALPLVAPATLPRLDAVRFDAASLAFAVAGSFAVGLVASLAPAWRFSGARLQAARVPGAIRVNAADGGRAADRFRRALVVAQVALAAVLLVGATLIGRSLMALVGVHPGYDPSGVLTFQIAFPEGAWLDKDRQADFFNALLARLEARPDVVAAGEVSTLPLLQVGSAGTFGIVGRPQPADRNDWPIAIHKAVTPGYFTAVGTRVLHGRGFTSADSNAAEKVAVVDEALARAYFPDTDPIGQHLIWMGRTTWRIVGLAESSHQGRMSSPVQPTIYLPAAQLPPVIAFNQYTGGVVVRTSGDPAALAPFARQAVRELDPTSPIFNVMTLEDRLDRTFVEPRFYALALGLFAALALSLAVLGVFGVLAYSVERRRIEFGIRRALGAREAQIGRLVLTQGGVLAATGLAIGLAVAAGGVRLMRSLLFGVTPFDPLTFASAATLVFAVAIGAAWQPARRALRVDPAEILHRE